MAMRITFLTLVAVFMGLLLMPLAAVAQEEQLTISAIEIRGNEYITDEEILGVMQGRAGEVFSLNTLSEDIGRIENLGWFATEPEHILEPFNDGVKVIIIVQENPVFGGVHFEQNGPGLFPQGDLALLFSLPSDKPINNGEVARGIAEIERKYREGGYTAATITDLSIGDDGVINISINEGVISNIIVQGNTKTRTHVIMRELNTQVGDVFKVDVFRRDLERIYNLQLFEDIKPSFELDENKQVVLYITVVEARTGQVGFGAGYSSNDGLLGTISYSERNFRGVGQRLTALGQIGGPNPDFQLSFYNPWIDRDHTSFSIEGFLFNESDRIRDPDDPDVVTPFELKRIGGSIGVVRPMNDTVTLSLTFKTLNGTVTFTDDEGNPLPPDQIPELSENEWVRSNLIDGTTNTFTSELAYDTRDFSLDPSQGALARAQLSMIGQFLGGDYDAFKYEVELREFLLLSGGTEDISDLSPNRFRENHVLAVRILYGGSTGDLPLIERFEMGGQYTVRGTEETAQSGDTALLFNSEYRFPVGGNLSGAVFFDAGTAAPPGEGLDFGNMLTTVGIGVRYRIPFFGIAPIRLDYGWDLDEGKGRIVFGFGQLF
jgi:outer membrane protein insertion porin family